MKQKTRYNIKLAEKKGVVVKKFAYPQSIKMLPTFMALSKATNDRDQIRGYDEKYYRTVLDVLGKAKMASLIVAFYKKKPLAAMIFIEYEETATYLFGASSNEKRNLMAPHLLQWKAIKYAQKQGLKTYDFFGVRVIRSKEIGNSRWEPMSGKTYGVTRFKLGFGGTVHDFGPAYDRSYSGFWYNGYRILKGRDKKGFCY